MKGLKKLEKSMSVGQKGKGSWWWDDSVQQKVKVKRVCHKT